MLEQTDIDSLLAAANALADEAQQELGGPEPEPVRRPTGRPRSAPRGGNTTTLNMPSEIRGILRMHVPVIAVLAERELAFQDVLNWTPGSIIEFDQSAEAELDLVVGNRAVGSGQAVKVGENFGIRITGIGEVDERIRAMGPS